MMDQALLTQIDAYIAAHRDQILAELLELVRIPSVRSAAEPGAPFGAACDQMLRRTAALLAGHGIPAEVNHDDGYLLAEYGDPAARTIGIFLHADVVPAEGEWQMCQPFDPVIRDGHVFGRGCNDDISGILQTLYAIRILRDLNLPLGSRLQVFVGSNEEDGMADMEAYVRAHPMPAASLVPDGGYPCYRGERGILRFTLTSKIAWQGIRGVSGGTAVNISLGDVTARLPYSRELEELCRGADWASWTREGQELWVTARGLSRHVANPEGAVNALAVLARGVADWSPLPVEDRRLLAQAARMVSDIRGEGFGIAHADPAFGLLSCGNGIVRTLPDGRLRLSFDIRAGVSCDLAQTARQIARVTAADWDFAEDLRSPGYCNDAEDPRLRALEQVYARLSGEMDARARLCAGATYARYLSRAYPIGTVAYYKAPSLELPEGHGGAHQPDEKLSVDGFLEAIKILVGMILALDETLAD